MGGGGVGWGGGSEGGDERGREGERGRSWGWGWGGGWVGWREEGGGAESLAIAKESFGKAMMHLLWHRVYRHGIREEADGKHSDGR